jgi:CRP-like cAMP-binding protein
MKAKVLEEKLIEPVPCAMPEMTRSGGMIKPELRKLADQDKMETLSYLDAGFNSDEQRALSRLLRARTCGPDECVFRQGELNFRLYFIHRGCLRITYHQERTENLLKTLSTGDIAGDDTFFSISVCTTSLTALCPTKLYTLDRKDLTRARDWMPTLESKLISYCQGLEKVYQLLAKKRIERRAYKRIKISGRTTVQVFQSSGSSLGMPFEGRLADISVGGLAVLSRISKDLDPPALLGRQLKITFDPTVDVSHEKTDKIGTIVAISTRPGEEYCLHIKFNEPLTEQRVSAMARVFQDGRDPVFPLDVY